MDTRLILQIALGAIVVLILVVGGLILFEVTRDADTEVIERVVERDDEPEERENPWASSENREAAISLVERRTVEGDDDERTVAEVLEDDEFVADKLALGDVEQNGWESTWWGETKYGPHFYLVRYQYEDANITVGPAWLVDLKEQEVVPKNVLAQVAESPEKGAESEYHDKADQVVGAITNHRFDSGVNLGGALLVYFSERAGDSDEDTIVGWTIQHDRGNKFDAYFQWVEDGEPTHAEFKFDYDRKALRADNLQAAHIMRAGEEFDESDKPVDIHPRAYDTDKGTWVGGQCEKQPDQDGCVALATVLEEDELTESLGWLLTAQAKTPDQFEACKEKGNCRFMPEPNEDGTFRILYVFNLERDEKFNPSDSDPEWACEFSLKADQEDDDFASRGDCVAWDVDPDEGTIKPVGRTSELAYRAIRPRSEF